MTYVDLNNDKEIVDEINLADYAATEDLISGIKLEKTNSEIFYLDENNNYTTEEYAVKSVIRVTDEEGNLIEEVWSTRGEEENENEVKPEFKAIYVDENENEVEEELATHLILKKYVDGKEVSSEKYPVNKDREMSM
ncbi:MAG: hypothetical protein IJ399_02625 [Bacilli bacterium]|nr:hypothetical protein [Bacilli bacterium]